MSAAPEPRAASWLRLAVVALVYLAAHRLGYLLLDPVAKVSSLWPAGGLALGLLLANQGGRRRGTLCAMAAANLASNLYSTGSILASLGFFASNALELIAAEAILLRASRGGVVAFATVSEVAALILSSTIVTGASAVIGAGTAAVLEGAPFAAALASWAISDALGVLVVTHLFLTLRAAPWAALLVRARAIEAAALGFFTLAIPWAYFSQGDRSIPHPGILMHSYMVVPPLLWAAMRFGPAGASLASAAVAALGIAVTIGGEGLTPLGGATPIDRLLSMQLYVGVVCVAGYVLAASIAERERDERALRRREEELREANRALRTLSDCNQVLVRATDEPSLLLDVCRVIVEAGGYALARVALAPHEPAPRPEGIVTLSQPTPARPAPASVAEQQADAAAEAARLGCRATLSLPLKGKKGTLGVLGIWSLDEHAFGPAQAKLLEELAEDLAFGVETLRARIDHDRAERALVSSEELMRQFVKHVPAAVAMFDTQMIYLHASDRWITDFSLEGQPIIGRSHYDVFPEMPERWREVHRRALAGAIERGDDDRFERRTGRIEWTTWEVRPWRTSSGEIGGISIFTQNNTARKEAEEARRAGDERFRQVVETIQEVFWMTDPSPARILYVSPSFEKIWGRPVAFVQEGPHRWLETVHADDRARVGTALSPERVAQGEVIEDYRILRPDGAERWIRDRAFPVRDAAGKLTSIVGVAEDITERRRTEEQLRQAQKMEAVGLLAGGVAHDFNNILAAIMMQAGLAVASPGLPPRAAALLKETIAAARRGAELTRQLLTFSRRQVMQRRRLDLNELLQSLATLLRRIMGEDVTIHLEAGPGPLHVEADKTMLDQLVMNLAVNARDAMPKGGRFEIRTDAFEVGPEEAATSEAPPGRYARLRVADTGTGIAPEHLPRIFEPFFTTKEPGKGTGLGLATVFGIVRQHKGTISVASEPGRGAAFTILLPAAESAPTPMPPAPEPEPVGGTESVLVVEDDATVRVLTRTILEGAGYRVADAADGPQALRVWEDRGGRFDLVLTDMVMPGGMTGREVAARLREKRPALRVVFTSGYSSGEAGRDIVLEAGQAFIEKPYAPQALLETVRRCLDRKPE